MPKIKKVSGIKQEYDRTWSIDTKITALNGVRKHLNRKGFRTYQEALDYLNEYKNKLESTYYKKETFDNLINEYKKMRKLRFNASTCESDESVYNVYLLPYFSGMKIKDVFTQRTIKEWYENLVSSTKYSENKKAKVITRIKDIIEFAWTHEYIDSIAHQQCNVVLYPISYTKKAKEERVIWTELEEREFLNTIKEQNTRDYLYFSLLLNTGLRMGEFLGLQVKCFDYKNNKLTICQQVVNRRNDGWYLTDILKTHESYRNVILPKYLSNMLKEHIDNFNLKENHFIVFNGNKNEPMGRTTLRRKLYYYCEVSGVRKANPHALRHNQAVKLASICDTTEKVEIAARRLGHSPSMFMDTYANHTNDEAQEALMSNLYDKKA